MTGLERRYSRALEWYPPHWRDANADAMLGTLLDEAESRGRTRPARGEIAALALFGTRERLHAALPASVRDRAAALAWGLGAALSATMLVVVEHAHWTADQAQRDRATSGFGPFDGASSVLFGLWIAGFIVAIAGRSRIAQWIVAATIPVSIALVAFQTQPWAEHRPPAQALLLLALLALVVLQGAPAAPQRARAWCLVSGIGSTAFFIPAASRERMTYPDDYWWDTRLLWVDITRPLPFILGFLAVGIVAVILGRYAWAAAAAMLCLPPLGFVGAMTLTGGADLVAAGVLVAVPSTVLLVGRLASRSHLDRFPGNPG